MQGASESGARSQLAENVQNSMVQKQDSIVCQSGANLDSGEADVACRLSETGPSFCTIDTFNAVTSSENNALYTGEYTNRGFVEPPISLEQGEQTEFSHKNVEHAINTDSGELHEGYVSSQPPGISSDSIVDSNTRFSHNSAEAVVSPTQNEVCLENVFDGESKPFEENFAEFSKQQLPNQAGGAAVVISTDLDGWQRFDSEENDGNRAFGFNQSINGKSLQKRELWEQLLEEGSEDSETHFQMSTAEVEAETGIDSALYGGNQFWLASPGNPFIECVDRLSNFSEADQCTGNACIAKSELLVSSEADIGSTFKDGPFHTDHSTDDILKNLGSQSNGQYDHENSQHAKPRFPSFSDIRRSSSKSRDPSLVSCVEEVSVFQADNYVSGIENGGEKWEANFDFIVPATQGLRSLSLPREAGQREKLTFSLCPGEAPVLSQPKPSGFSSPKLSPIVKKVVNKVWTKPVQVENVVHCAKSSHTRDREPKKRIWRCCICCSHVK